MLAAMHSGAEPGVLFVDRIDRVNNLWYAEQLGSTNPCGEVPLPPSGACNLGSINLTRFVQHPFGPHPAVDFAGLRAVAAVATRFLDDMYELSPLPLKSQEKVACTSRRIGLGITGLADMFLMLGLRYGSPASLELARQIMVALRDTAYRTSVALAQRRVPLPALTRFAMAPAPLCSICRTTSRTASPCTASATAICWQWRRPARSACSPTMSPAASSRCRLPGAPPGCTRPTASSARWMWKTMPGASTGPSRGRSGAAPRGL